MLLSLKRGATDAINTKKVIFNYTGRKESASIQRPESRKKANGKKGTTSC
jgi:hypothetical protein